METKKCEIKLYGTTSLGPKGQIVIPKELRDKLNLSPGDSLSFILKNEKFIGIVKNEDLGDLMEYVQSFNN